MGRKIRGEGVEKPGLVLLHILSTVIHNARLWKTLLQRLHQGVDLVVENRIRAAQVLDLSNGMNHR